jgi:TPR repeat protein
MHVARRFGCVLVATLSLASVSCAFQRGAFNAALADCGSNLDACRERCVADAHEIDPQASGYCNVTRVLIAETTIAAGTNGPPEIVPFKALIADVKRICGDGVERACNALTALQALLPRKEEQAAAFAKLDQRVQEALKKANQAKADGPSFANVAVEVDATNAEAGTYSHLAHFGGSDLSVLEGHVAAAEKHADAAQEGVGFAKIAAELARADRDQRARNEQVRRQALLEAQKACGYREEFGGESPLPAACKEQCDLDASSLTCVILGAYYRDGRKVDVDYAKARALFQRACGAGNQDGCREVPRMDEILSQQAETRAAQKNAEASLPGLFAKCESARAPVVVLKAQVLAAARARDRDRIAALQGPLTEAAQRLADIGHELDAAIDNATQREQPRYGQLILEGRRRCLVP